MPDGLETRIEAFVSNYNYHRFHESLNNLTPAGVYYGRGEGILEARAPLKCITIGNRRLQNPL
jgi:putative transposase